MNKHSKQFERKKVFKGKIWAGIEKKPKLKVEFEEEPIPERPLTTRERIKKWFTGLPIWSVK